MYVVCVGGGPAGLYFAISMKLRDAAHDVLVVERNRPDDTFGWGVVFSNETLDNLWQNDPESAAVIKDSFQHWDDIDVHFKGRVIHSWPPQSSSQLESQQPRVVNPKSIPCERLLR